MSFRHSSDCHSYYRAHFLIVMTLFIDWRRPYVTALLSPFTTSLVTRLSVCHRFVSFSLFQSFCASLRRQTVQTVYSFFIRLHSTSHDLHSISYELYSTAPAPAAPLYTSSGPQRRTRALGIRRAPTVLPSVRSVLQQWCLDLHLRVFTLRKNLWSPASPPQAVCERLVSTFSFHLSLRSYGSNPISEPLFGLTWVVQLTVLLAGHVRIPAPLRGGRPIRSG